MPRLMDLFTEEISFVPEGANNKQFIIFKEDHSQGDLYQQIQTLVAEEIKKHIAGNLPQKGVNKMAEGQLNREQVLAYIPENVRDQVSKLWVGSEKTTDTLPESVTKELQDIRKENDDLKKALKAETDQRVLKEYQEKAKSFSNLNMNPLELGTILKQMSESVKKEDYDKIEQVLKAANEMKNQASLFREIGSNSAESGTAWDKIQSIAKEYVSQGKSKNLPEAITKAMEENPVLYSEYLNERK